MDYPVVTQPEKYNRNLIKHQLTSIYNMEDIERKRKISINGLYEIHTDVGIQADPTGYGKTESMIYLFLQ